MTTLAIQGSDTNKLTQLLATQERSISVVYRGTTTTTDVTELFINGISGYRIQPPAQSTGIVEVQVLGYNTTDDAAATTVANSSTKAFFSRLGTTTAVTQVTDVTNVFNDAICTVTADDTNEYVKINVTAADTDTYDWKVFVTIYCHAEEDVAIDGVFDDTPK